MKSKLKYLITADNFIIDQNTGKLSLIGIFNDINGSSKDTEKLVSFVVAGRIYVEETIHGNNQGVLKIVIYDPNNVTLIEKEAKGLFNESRIVNFALFFTFVKFNLIGKYCIKVYLNNTEVESDTYDCNINFKLN